MKKIFISYASEQREHAEPIALSLRQRGFRVFLDKDDSTPGEGYDQQIDQVIKSSDYLIFLISPDSVEKGTYALTELKFAREKWRNPSGRVLPVMVKSTQLKDIPPYLKAVSILEPSGNIAAEVSSKVAAAINELQQEDGDGDKFDNDSGSRGITPHTWDSVRVKLSTVLAIAAAVFVLNGIMTYGYIKLMDFDQRIFGNSGKVNYLNSENSATNTKIKSVSDEIIFNRENITQIAEQLQNLPDGFWITSLKFEKKNDSLDFRLPIPKSSHTMISMYVDDFKDDPNIKKLMQRNLLFEINDDIFEQASLFFRDHPKEFDIKPLLADKLPYQKFRISLNQNITQEEFDIIRGKQLSMLFVLNQPISINAKENLPD